MGLFLFMEFCCNWLLGSTRFLKASLQEMSLDKFEFEKKYTKANVNILLIEISREMLIFMMWLKVSIGEVWFFFFLKQFLILTELPNLYSFQWLTCDGRFSLWIISSPWSFFFLYSLVYYNQIVRIERKQSQINFTCKLFPIPPIQKSYHSVIPGLV